METTKLYRPVNKAELDLIQESKWKGFPPRLPDQYIFYPVTNEYRENPNSFISKMTLFKTKLEMKFTPERFKEKLMKSANEPYKSTKKDENVW